MVEDNLPEFNFNNPRFSKRTILSILALVILLISIPLGVYLAQQKQIFKPRAYENKANLAKREQAKYRGYIIELKNDPLVKYKKSLENTGKKDKNLNVALDNYRKTLQDEHIKAKEDILLRLNKKSFYSPQIRETEPVVLLREYSDVFNGLALDISDAQADKIRQSPYIKRVARNNQVKALLADSVPMIHADDVWQLKDSQGKNVTGEGVNIAIIDTGADYTHPDLGASKIDERPFDQITTNPLIFGAGRKEYDHTLVMNNNRLAYYSGDRIYIYDFTTKQTQKITLYSDDLSPIKIDLDEDILAYFAVGTDFKPALYYYNLTNGKHQKLSITHYVRSLAITNQKIIYGREQSYGSGTEGTYIYDTQSDQETQLSTPALASDYPYASNGKIVYSVSSSSCFDKIVLYDLETKTSQDLRPPEVGGVIDFKGDQILYVACNPYSFDSSFSTYYLYNIKTGQALRLHYVQSGSKTVGKTFFKQDFGDYYMVVFNGNQGGIGQDIVAFGKQGGSNQTIIYDEVQQRYVAMNLLKGVYALAVENKQVCFISDDQNIYCHTYNPADPYTLSTQIFNQKVVGGYDFVNEDDAPMDDYGHGTHVASIAAGKPMSVTSISGGGGPTPTPAKGPLIGVAPEGKLYAYKVLDSYGSGYSSDIIAALEKIVDSKLDSDTSNDISVANMSLGMDCLGSYDPNCGPDDLMSQAVDNAVDAGIVMVVAAGNSGASPSTIGSPGTARKAITVGAVDKSSVIALFSSRGPVSLGGEVINKPDVVAPGVSICAAEWDSWYTDRRCVDDKHISLDGTSMATPHVAGMV